MAGLEAFDLRSPIAVPACISACVVWCESTREQRALEHFLDKNARLEPRWRRGGRRAYLVIPDLGYSTTITTAGWRDKQKRSKKINEALEEERKKYAVVCTATNY